MFANQKRVCFIHVTFVMAGLIAPVSLLAWIGWICSFSIGVDFNWHSQEVCMPLQI